MTHRLRIGHKLFGHRFSVRFTQNLVTVTGVLLVGNAVLARDDLSRRGASRKAGFPEACVDPPIFRL